MNLAGGRDGRRAELAVRDYYAVKSPVFPFNKFRGVDTILGPEMRSTGEVMGVAHSFGEAFAKAQLAAGQGLPRKGTIFLSVNDQEKRQLLPWRASWLAGIHAARHAWHRGGARRRRHTRRVVFKVNEGRPNIVDLVKTGKVDLIINTPLGRESFYDEKSIRRAAVRYKVPCITTLSAAQAAARGIRALVEQNLEVRAAAVTARQKDGCASGSRRR